MHNDTDHWGVVAPSSAALTAATHTAVLVASALSRAFAYLHSSGVDINKAVALTVLRLIEELLQADHADLLTVMMQKLPERITLPQPQLPLSFPLIHRGSIGYDQR